jgi:hypothetical protein
MGQDAFANYGVTTTVRLTWDNLPLIRKLLELEQSELVEIHIWAGGCCTDEVMVYSHEYDDDEYRLPWKCAFESQTEEEFNQHYCQLGLNVDCYDRSPRKDDISVICPIFHAEARNISRRDLPEIFGQSDTNRPILKEIESINQSLHQAVELLSDCGVPESSIKMGWIYSLDP